MLRALLPACLLCGCAALVPAATDSFGEEGGDASDGGTTTPAPDLPPPAPSDIVIATFNVHLFFDTRCDSGQCGGGDFEDAPNQGQFDYRADELAAAIAALDADVVLLQEVENDACLDALQQRLDGAYPTAILGETDFAASVDVAVLARDPTLEVRRHGDPPIPLPGGGETWFAREFLEVHLDADGHRVVVFAAHFKSKNDDDPERRLAEATRARELVDAAVAAHPEALVVLGGDLNDTPGSPPLAALEGEGGMLRVAAELVPDDWTYTYDGERRALDHLYQAVDADGGEFVAGSAHVFRGEFDEGWGGSDHAAVRASFRAGP
jgi:endonuclease/exonuclease/phosphatase family metal-dependent hydrolase